jgi:uncharacterized protein (UPF0548 family)
MSPRALPRADTRLTYAEVGATQGALPAGYHHLRRRESVGRGEAAFAAAAEVVMTWGVQRGAGFTVEASAPRASVGAVVRPSVGIGPMRVSAPCRVVYVVDEPHRKGFAYGTLPGHPETGEEAFVVSLLDDGAVEFEIVAFSRPATLWSRAGGPLNRLVQRVVTNRYVAAVRQP